MNYALSRAYPTGFPGYLQPNSLLTTTFLKLHNAFLLTNSQQHFKMKLKPDLFVSKPMDFQKKNRKCSLTISSKKITTINNVLKK